MRDDRSRDEDARRREADAILRRVRQETEPQLGAGRRAAPALGRPDAAQTRDPRAEDHGADDPIDRLGTRIGRTLGALVFVGLAVSLVATFLKG